VCFGWPGRIDGNQSHYVFSFFLFFFFPLFFPLLFSLVSILAFERVPSIRVFTCQHTYAKYGPGVILWKAPRLRIHVRSIVL